jgi:hypothetical protein
MRVPFVLGIVLALGASTAAAGQDNKPSLRELMAQGFEVKAVTNIEMAMMKPLGYDDDTAPQLLVTLENGSSLAVCQFSVANWSLMNPEAMDGHSQCDTMDYRASNTSSGQQTLEPAEHLRR